MGKLFWLREVEASSDFSRRWDVAKAGRLVIGAEIRSSRAAVWARRDAIVASWLANRWSIDDLRQYVS